MLKLKIISGGQTGVDRAALDAAIETGLPYGGLIPKGRKSEEGQVPEHYSELQEAHRTDYEHRTEQNVIGADATLILSYPPLEGGTLFTETHCKHHQKKHLVVDLNQPEVSIEREILQWLSQTNPRVLNIAGPRESKRPGIYVKTRRILTHIFEQLS